MIENNLKQFKSILYFKRDNDTLFVSHEILREISPLKIDEYTIYFRHNRSRCLDFSDELGELFKFLGIKEGDKSTLEYIVSKTHDHRFLVFNNIEESLNFS